MIAFIDDHRAVYGVEPTCNVLPAPASTYHDHVTKRADPSASSDARRSKWDGHCKIARAAVYAGLAPNPRPMPSGGIERFGKERTTASVN